MKEKKKEDKFYINIKRKEKKNTKYEQAFGFLTTFTSHLMGLEEIKIKLFIFQKMKKKCFYLFINYWTTFISQLIIQYCKLFCNN